MIIRPANDTDVPTIVALLKQSLGESLMPKSEQFWNWKHNQNPFGKSPVLLAFEGDILVGVRAFMRWEWTDQNRSYRAVRAVDTATHPAYQGKGIFKKLTLQLVEQCKAEGVDFIFNTPNKSSMPGYLKMGWVNLGRLPVQFKLHLFRSSAQKKSVKDDWQSLQTNAIVKTNCGKRITTQLTPEYLFWRYRDNPNIQYHLISNNDEPFALIYRIKKIKGITEVRITNLFAPNTEGKVMALQELSKYITGPAIISLNDDGDRLASLRFAINGPVITGRNLNMSHWPQSLDFKNWSPSLGDLELF